MRSSVGGRQYWALAALFAAATSSYAQAPLSVSTIVAQINPTATLGQMVSIPILISVSTHDQHWVLLAQSAPAVASGFATKMTFTPTAPGGAPNCNFPLIPTLVGKPGFQVAEGGTTSGVIGTFTANIAMDPLFPAGTYTTTLDLTYSAPPLPQQTVTITFGFTVAPYTSVSFGQPALTFHSTKGSGDFLPDAPIPLTVCTNQSNQTLALTLGTLQTADKKNSVPAASTLISWDKTSSGANSAALAGSLGKNSLTIPVVYGKTTLYISGKVRTTMALPAGNYSGTLNATIGGQP